MNLHPMPTRILDVGIGFGKYGFLCREYIQYWNSPDKVRQVTVEGIEAYPNYVGDLQKLIYDRIFIGEAFDLLSSFPDLSYDLILMIDVLEHFKKDIGVSVIREITRVSKVAIISTPRQFWKQEDSWGNPFEMHKSLWTKRDLMNLGASHVLKSENWIAVYAKPPYSTRFTYRYKLYRAYHKLVG